MAQLRRLSIRDTQVSDGGLAHIAGLRQLKELSLGGAKITDAGLEHLNAMQQLEVLGLDDTSATDAGVKKLQKSLPRCAVYVEHVRTDETDQELRDLKKALIDLEPPRPDKRQSPAAPDQLR